MCARVAEVVSVPGPKFSVASDSAVSGDKPALTSVVIKLGVLELLRLDSAIFQLFVAHCHVC